MIDTRSNYCDLTDFLDVSCLREDLVTYPFEVSIFPSVFVSVISSKFGDHRCRCYL